MNLQLVATSEEGSKSVDGPKQTEDDKRGLAVALANFGFEKCLVNETMPCVHALRCNEGPTVRRCTLYCNRTGDIIVLTSDLAAGCADPIEPEPIVVN